MAVKRKKISRKRAKRVKSSKRKGRKKKQLKRKKISKKRAKKAKSPAKSRPRRPMEIILPKKLPVKPPKVVVVYGMKVEPENITRAAIEAYNKRRYTVHDIRLIDYISDPKFRNLMVKIAVLDRIEEELLRIYPDAEIIRPNTVTLMVR